MDKARISFARTLPIVALLLSFLITAIPATIAYSHQLQHSAPHALRDSLTTAASHTSHTVQALNMPAFLVEIFSGVLSGEGLHGWSPYPIDLLTWRAIIFPIYCLPFWWFVGLAMDALLAGHRLRRSLLFVGCILWATSFSLMCVWVISAAPRALLILPYFGFALWICLLSVFPGTLVRERLAHRRLRTRSVERLLSRA